MATAALSRIHAEAALPLGQFERNVQVNALSVDQLFGLYERVGFLYPAKAARLKPHLDTVRDNWHRLLSAESPLLYVLTAGDDRDGYASIAMWRTTRTSWIWQHLVSEGNPLRSRDVMLAGMERGLRLGLGESQQNWFRPENRFPARVFGTMVKTLGDPLASVRRHLYFAVPREPQGPPPASVRIVPYDASLQPAICALGAYVRGERYVTAEELDRDVELQSVDSLYRSVGLRRTRQAWIACRARSGQVVGAALAYRGPLGLNFSFIENRCDLLVSPSVLPSEAADVTTALMHAAAPAYADSALDHIPVVADEVSERALVACGGEVLRHYCHGIWLKDGQLAFGRHVNGFYTRLLDRANRSRTTSSDLTA